MILIGIASEGYDDIQRTILTKYNQNDIKKMLLDMQPPDIPCAHCGTFSTYAVERHERGETPLCYSCTVAANTGASIRNDCSCTGYTLWTLGCQCDYAKRKKREGK